METTNLPSSFPHVHRRHTLWDFHARKSTGPPFHKNSCCKSLFHSSPFCLHTNNQPHHHHCQNEGWLLHGDKDRIWITKEKGKIVFDIKIPAPKGAVYAMYFKHLSVQGELANGMTDGGLKIMIGQAHAHLGHIGEDAVCKITGHIGWHLTRGRLMACEACAAGKARQRNLGSHLLEPLPESNRMRVFLDISSIKKPESISRVHKPHLRIIVIEAMQLKFVHFFEMKD